MLLSSDELFVDQRLLCSWLLFVLAHLLFLLDLLDALVKIWIILIVENLNVLGVVELASVVTNFVGIASNLNLVSLD